MKKTLTIKDSFDMDEYLDKHEQYDALDCDFRVENMQLLKELAENTPEGAKLSFETFSCGYHDCEELLECDVTYDGELVATAWNTSDVESIEETLPISSAVAIFSLDVTGYELPVLTLDFMFNTEKELPEAKPRKKRNFDSWKPQYPNRVQRTKPAHKPQTTKASTVISSSSKDDAQPTETKKTIENKPNVKSNCEYISVADAPPRTQKKDKSSVLRKFFRRK